jgi:hypothetical protein
MSCANYKFTNKQRNNQIVVSKINKNKFNNNGNDDDDDDYYCDGNDIKNNINNQAWNNSHNVPNLRFKIESYINDSLFPEIQRISSYQYGLKKGFNSYEYHLSQKMRNIGFKILSILQHHCKLDFIEMMKRIYLDLQQTEQIEKEEQKMKNIILIFLKWAIISDWHPNTWKRISDYVSSEFENKNKDEDKYNFDYFVVEPNSYDGVYKFLFEFDKFKPILSSPNLDFKILSNKYIIEDYIDQCVIYRK